MHGEPERLICHSERSCLSADWSIISRARKNFPESPPLPPAALEKSLSRDFRHFPARRKKKKQEPDRRCPRMNLRGGREFSKSPRNSITIPSPYAIVVKNSIESPSRVGDLTQPKGCRAQKLFKDNRGVGGVPADETFETSLITSLSAAYILNTSPFEMLTSRFCMRDTLCARVLHARPPLTRRSRR